MLDLKEMIQAIDEAIVKAKNNHDYDLVRSLEFERKSYEYSLNCGNGRFTGTLYPQGMRRR